MPPARSSTRPGPPRSDLRGQRAQRVRDRLVVPAAEKAVARHHHRGAVAGARPAPAAGQADVALAGDVEAVPAAAGDLVIAHLDRARRRRGSGRSAATASSAWRRSASIGLLTAPARCHANYSARERVSTGTGSCLREGPAECASSCSPRQARARERRASGSPPGTGYRTSPAATSSARRRRARPRSASSCSGYLDRGDLVPDDLVLSLVKDRVIAASEEQRRLRARRVPAQPGAGRGGRGHRQRDERERAGRRVPGRARGRAGRAASRAAARTARTTPRRSPGTALRCTPSTRSRWWTTSRPAGSWSRSTPRRRRTRSASRFSPRWTGSRTKSLKRITQNEGG